MQMEKVSICNSTKENLDLVIEPDGQVLTIPPNLCLEVRATDVPGGRLEVVVRASDFVLVYGWKNWVYYEDLEIYPNNTHPNWPPAKTNEKKL